MYIKEFEIACELLPPEDEVREIAEGENLSFEEAEKKWHYDVHRVKHNITVEETRCICAYFERLFPRVQLGDFWKLEVVLTDKQEYKEFVDCLGVCEVKIRADHREFMTLKGHEKKVKTLELFMKGLKRFSEISGYPYSEFEKYADIIRDSDYENIWIWQPKKSGKRRAQVRVRHEIDFIEFTFEVYEGDIPVYKTKRLVLPPDEWFFKPYLGRLKWESHDRVVWYYRDGGIVEEFSFMAWQ